MSQTVQTDSSTHFLNWSAFPQFLAHQIGWWACVLLMGWQGPLIMVFFLILHLYMTRPHWHSELFLIGVSLLVGIGLDNALYAFGAVDYIGELLLGGAPVWLAAIWAGFGATLMHHQSIFVRRVHHAVIIGVAGGPLAYLGGVKLARMSVNGFQGWLSISAAWTVAMLVLYAAVKRVERKREA